MSCSRPLSTETTSTTTNTATTSTSHATDNETIDVADAVAIRVAAGADGSVWAAWSEGTELFVAEVDPVAVSVGSPTVVAGPEGIINHPLERPALAITADGEVFVAWITGSGNVRLARLVTEGAAVSSEVISGEVRNETALVQMIATAQGQPVVSWLEDSTLSVAAGEPLVEHELVDDLTCDCCHPVPIQIGDQMGIGYRDLEHTTDGVVRDIAFINGSLSGASFTASVVVADESWYLDACPLSGPTLAVSGDDVFISWMDARQSLHPDQSSSSIWFDSSGDGGQTFGTDIRLTSDDATYRTPAMAVDSSGVIHLVWERRTPEEATLEYTSSSDGGQTFAEPRPLVEGDEESGVPREAALIVVGEQMLVSWADGEGGHIGIWPLTP
ncbi:MAG: sialidase family protein [Acidimicrobiia bacterium]